MIQLLQACWDIPWQAAPLGYHRQDSCQKRNSRGEGQSHGRRNGPLPQSLARRKLYWLKIYF